MYLLANIMAQLKGVFGLLEMRLPPRCVVCHREILDEVGVVLHEDVFHKNCAVATKENLDRIIAEADKRSPPRCRWADVWP